MESDTLHFWLTCTGARGCLATLAMPVTGASPAEGASVQQCCPSCLDQTTPQAELGPSALAVATGCHPALGWQQASLWPGLA